MKIRKSKPPPLLSSVDEVTEVIPMSDEDEKVREDWERDIREKNRREGHDGSILSRSNIKEKLRRGEIPKLRDLGKYEELEPSPGLLLSVYGDIKGGRDTVLEYARYCKNKEYKGIDKAKICGIIDIYDALPERLQRRGDILDLLCIKVGYPQSRFLSVATEAAFQFQRERSLLVIADGQVEVAKKINEYATGDAKNFNDRKLAVEIGGLIGGEGGKGKTEVNVTIDQSKKSVIINESNNRRLKSLTESMRGNMGAMGHGDYRDKVRMIGEGEGGGERGEGGGERDVVDGEYEMLEDEVREVEREEKGEEKEDGQPNT